MIFLYLFITFILGVALGGNLHKRLTERALKLEQEKVAETKKTQFVEILDKVKSGGSKFTSRVNDTVYLSLTLKEHGPIDLIYLIDKNDVAIFQQSKCLYTSDGIDKELLGEIISTIFRIYGRKINDVVEILGFTFYREEFEKSFNIKAEDLKKANFLAQSQVDMTEIDKIKIENQKRFNIDEILDKISAFGISSLSIEERSFLDNYSNEKRD